MKNANRAQLVVGIALVSAAWVGVGCASSKPRDIVQVEIAPPETQYEVIEAERFSIVGEAGPEGPAGPAGAQGERGHRGEPGYAVAGPQGVAGPAGPTGVRGVTGATGPEGAVVAGAAGVRGPAGPAGVQGERGSAGAQGASAAGYAGPAGVAGPQGVQGPAGLTGARGPTLTGPTGPAGAAGRVGAQGASGQAGVQGSTMAGVAGPTGIAGPTGATGNVGSTGVQGSAGVVDSWTSYREFWFEFDRADIHPSDARKVSEIVSYIKNNPSLQVGIDGSENSNGSDPSNPGLRDRRISAVREALMKAGLPERSIQIGTLGDPKTRRDRRVEVLIRSYQVTQVR